MTAAFANVLGALLHCGGSVGNLKEEVVERMPKQLGKFVRWRKCKLLSFLKEQAWKL